MLSLRYVMRLEDPFHQMIWVTLNLHMQCPCKHQQKSRHNSDVHASFVCWPLVMHPAACLWGQKLCKLLLRYIMHTALAQL